MHKQKESKNLTFDGPLLVRCELPRAEVRHHAAHVLHRRREVEARRRRGLATLHGAGSAEWAEVVLAVSQVVLLGLLVLLHLVQLQLQHGAGGGVVRLVVLRRGGGGWRDTSKHGQNEN